MTRLKRNAGRENPRTSIFMSRSSPSGRLPAGMYSWKRSKNFLRKASWTLVKGRLTTAEAAAAKTPVKAPTKAPSPGVTGLGV